MVILQKSGGSKNSITSSVLGNDSERSNCETASDGFEVRIKVRKPYTISKQREKWTEEEHQKFIKAIKLYGRAWRQIEEYIGTKTAVQIRSHAQKFFSKVAKEGSDYTDGSSEPVEIPPPRPKRKSLHPYPRKLVETSNNAKACLSFHEGKTSTSLKTVRELHSPTSVLAPEGSQIYISSAKDLGSGSTSATSPDSSLQKAVKEIGYIESSKNKGGHLESGIKVASLKTIKLFGHTVVVSNPLKYSVDQLVSSDVKMGDFGDLKKSPAKEGSIGKSSTALNIASVIKTKNQVTNQDYADSVTEFNLGLKKYMKGFVPYIRCASDREVVSLMNHMDDRRSQHVYL